MEGRACRTVEPFAAITLDDMVARASLQTRVDNKYVVSWDVFCLLTEELVDTYAVLEIGGRRTFGYRSVYFDTDTLTTYRAHVQRRRRRFKCRSRQYLDSGLHVFEVKLKGARGETVKRQMAYEREDALLATPAAQRFVRECLRADYGLDFRAELVASLCNEYRRMTFAAHDSEDRLTCDFGLWFETPDGHSGQMLRDFLILETKSPRGTGRADRMLKALGVRPANCSKYCLGTALTRPAVKSNDFRWLLRRYFEPLPASA